MISVKIIHLTNKTYKDGTSAVVLRVLKSRKKKEIYLNLKCYPKEFKDGEFVKTVPNYKVKNRALIKIRERAATIIDEIILKGQDVSLEEFEKIFRGENIKEIPTVKVFFDEIIKENLQSGRIGNARVYKETKNALFRFVDDTLKFTDITPEFLDKFEVYMRSRGNQDGGIALKMRELRALYKKAISREYVDKSLYPFEKYKLSHLKRKSHKRALSIQEFRLMRDFDTTFYPQLRHTHMYFLFSFYCRGINFTDLCLLKWSDIRGNHITYIRSKTKGKFSIEILPKVQEILDYFKEKFPDSKYIFPIILQENPTPIYLENRIKKTLQKFNRELKKIASIAGIETNITSYVIRHSYATLMKFSGISPQIISESMGHSNVEITNAYLKEFESEVIDEANRKLEDL